MDIRASLTAGHSRALTTKIVNYIGADKVRFKMLMQIFLGNDPRLQQRSAWAMSDIAVQHPQLIKPYLKHLLPKLNEEGHPAIKRNILRIIQYIEVPEKYEAQLFDDCFRMIRNSAYPVAIRAFAVTVAANICNKYPELKGELKPVLKELLTMPQLPAITHRIKLTLKAWEA
jgi:hypothetical protein